jgi:formamidopyrimidine-DNA glycosylase
LLFLAGLPLLISRNRGAATACGERESVPELPEVETVRRGLEPVLVGRRIAAAEIRRPDLRWPLPPNLGARLTGARVLGLRRRSKYLLADLDGGDTLIVHLGMSGRMLVASPADLPLAAGAERAAIGAFVHAPELVQKHDHVILHVEDGARVTFNDARRFGAMDLWPTATLETHPRIAVLGPEPLGNAFDAAYLAARLARRMSPVKAVLLDQGAVAGLGNIYVCEALWRAGVSPLRLAQSVAAEEAERLVTAIRAVLLEAIDAGGSSLRDYRRADGELGYFQHAFAVYGRTGAPCPRCGSRIARTPQGGRSSFHCPTCQPEA